MARLSPLYISLFFLLSFLACLASSFSFVPSFIPFSSFITSFLMKPFPWIGPRMPYGLGVHYPLQHTYDFQGYYAQQEGLEILSSQAVVEMLVELCRKINFKNQALVFPFCVQSYFDLRVRGLTWRDRQEMTRPHQVAIMELSLKASPKMT